MTNGSNTYQRCTASAIPQTVKSTNTYMGCCRREYNPCVTRSFAFGVTANDLPSCTRATTTSANETAASATPAQVSTFIASLLNGASRGSIQLSRTKSSACLDDSLDERRRLS